MGIKSVSRYDYFGYGSEFLIKSDISVKRLKRDYGIITNLSNLNRNLENCKCGYISTGGNGHIKHSKIYSISLIRDFINLDINH